MEIVWVAGLIALWGVVLIDLLLTLRIVRWMRAAAALQEEAMQVEDLPELQVGAPAPAFQAETLSGERAGLDDYAGRAVAFIFVSPYCKDCQQEMPMLVELGARMSERTDIELVLVCDSGTVEQIQGWIDLIRDEDELEVDLPILVASRSTPEFVRSYNPRGLAPYFCYIDDQGIVRARAPLGTAKWRKMKQEWEAGASESSTGQITGGAQQIEHP
jgi:hypothetical protein